MLRVNGLFKTYDGKRLTPAPVTFELDAQTRVAFVDGPNGSGKTTLLKLLSGEERPSGGSFTLETPESIAVVYQRDGLLPEISALDNLKFLKFLDAELFTEAGRIGFNTNLLSTMTRSLSGGEEKRMQFLRAQLSRRQIWLLDEPTASADSALRECAVEVITSHVASGGFAVIITHDKAFHEALRANLARVCLTVTIETQESFSITTGL